MAAKVGELGDKNGKQFFEILAELPIRGQPYLLEL